MSTTKAADPRFLRSRDLIVDAVTALIDGEALASISITRVVEKAGVSRPTFYQHFEDLPGAAGAAALRRLARAFPVNSDPATELTKAGLRKKIEERARPVLEHLWKERSFYRRVLATSASTALFDELVAFVSDRIMIYGAGRRRHAPETHEQVGVVLGGGLMWLVIRWLQTERAAKPPAEMAREVGAVLSAIISEVQS